MHAFHRIIAFRHVIQSITGLLMLAWLGSGVSVAQQTSAPVGSDRGFQLLDSRKHQRTDREITYNKVAKPVLPDVTHRSSPTPPPAATVNRGEDTNTQRVVALTISYTPLDETLTALSWADENERIHHVFSNVNFEDFPPIFRYSEAGTIYSVILIPGVLAPQTFPDNHPGLADLFVRKSSSFSYVKGGSGEDVLSVAELDLLDVLHSYYAINRDRMVRAREHREREAEAAQREQERKAREPVVINFWKITTSPR